MFATKEDFKRLENMFHEFAEMVMQAFEKLATKDDVLRLERNHGARIDILEDRVSVLERITVLTTGPAA